MSARFTIEQIAEIERLADERAARLISIALRGAHQRIAEAIGGSVVLLPVVHAHRSTEEGSRHHG